MLLLPRTFRSLSPDEPSEWGKGYFLGARERREEGGGLGGGAGLKEGGKALSRSQRRKLRKHQAALTQYAVGCCVGRSTKQPQQPHVLVLGCKVGVQGKRGIADEAAKAYLKRHTLKKNTAALAQYTVDCCIGRSTKQPFARIRRH